MTGRIERTHGVNPAWEIQVDGYKAVRYMDYTKREAIRQYRRRFRLVYKRIEWRDYTKPGMPQNLYEAFTMAMQSNAAKTI